VEWEKNEETESKMAKDPFSAAGIAVSVSQQFLASTWRSSGNTKGHE